MEGNFCLRLILGNVGPLNWKIFTRGYPLLLLLLHCLLSFSIFHFGSYFTPHFLSLPTCVNRIILVKKFIFKKPEFVATGVREGDGGQSCDFRATEVGGAAPRLNFVQRTDVDAKEDSSRWKLWQDLREKTFDVWNR